MTSFLSKAVFTSIIISILCLEPVLCRRHLLKLYYDSVVFETDEEFLSFAIDASHFMEGVSPLNLKNQILLSLTQHLSPAYLRIGGIAADRLLFKNEIITSESKFSASQNLSGKPEKLNISYFTGDDFLQLHEFARLTNVNLVFDLNVLIRSNNSWDPTNAEQLFAFCKQNGLKNDWQLGNEPNAYRMKFNQTVTPNQLATDFQTLKYILKSSPYFLSSKLIGPDVTRPLKQKTLSNVNQIKPTNLNLDQPAFYNFRKSPVNTNVLSSVDINEILEGPFEDNSILGLNLPPVEYLNSFLESGGNDAVDIIGFHQYYLDPDSNVLAYLNVSTFDILEYQIKVIKNIVTDNYKNRPVPPIWLSESGSTVGGGVLNLTDTFAASFLWIDKLGLSAKLGISVVVRQSLIFGHYSLIDMHTLKPNPDWWLSVLYKRLVDPRVLDIYIPLSHKTLRLYAHCSPRNNITVFGVNVGTVIEKVYFREECLVDIYSVKSCTEEIQTRNICLNGNSLQMNTDGTLPPMDPIKRDTHDKEEVIIPPQSVIFMEILVKNREHACHRD